MLKIYLYSLPIVIFFVLFVFARVIEIYAPYRKAGIKFKEDSLTDRIRIWVQLIFLILCPVINLIIWGYIAFIEPTEKLQDTLEDTIFERCADNESENIFFRVKYGDHYKDDSIL